MAYIRKKLRNECIIYDKDVLKLSYRQIGLKYRIKRNTACEVYHREKKREEKQKLSPRTTLEKLTRVRTSI